MLGAIAALLTASAMSLAGAQEAQPQAKPAVIAFHIPSQSLANALQAYGEKAGVQVLYESRSATGRRSAAVDGNYTAADALALLLTGTDLRVHYARPNAITLALQNAPPEGAANVPSTTELSLGTLRVRPTEDPDEVGRLHEYNASLQADIQRVLQKNAGTRAGNYRVTLDLWIDPTRTVQRVEMIRSTGSQDRDTAVASALRGVTVSRPTPAQAVQPVRLVIVVRSMP